VGLRLQVDVVVPGGCSAIVVLFILLEDRLVGGCVALVRVAQWVEHVKEGAGTGGGGVDRLGYGVARESTIIWWGGHGAGEGRTVRS